MIEADHYRLVAHGAACQNQVNEQTWSNNPVNGFATCVFTTTDNNKGGSWLSEQNPKKIAELATGSTDVRQCYLTAVTGVNGAWASSTSFARVRRVTSTDATHPTTGWYIEANLPKAQVDGSHAEIVARGVNYKSTVSLTSNTTPLDNNLTKTYTITSGTGIKACALRGITGAFTVNSWTNGVVMNWPDKIDGNWSVTVSAGTTATWACAK